MRKILFFAAISAALLASTAEAAEERQIESVTQTQPEAAKFAGLIEKCETNYLAGKVLLALLDPKKRLGKIRFREVREICVAIVADEMLR